MTHAVELSGRGLFSGLQLLEIFVGVLVEGLDATFAAEPHQFSLIKAVDGFSHATEFVARDQTSGEGISFGLFRGEGFFFRGFDDLGFRSFGNRRSVSRLKGEGEDCGESQKTSEKVFHSTTLVPFYGEASHSPLKKGK